MKKYITPDWHDEVYLNNTLLGAEWGEMERSGEAMDSVKAVGEMSRDEWKELMHKLLERALDKRDVRSQ